MHPPFAQAGYLKSIGLILFQAVRRRLPVPLTEGMTVTVVCSRDCAGATDQRTSSPGAEYEAVDRASYAGL